MAKDTGWIVLAYTLPPEPSRMRVSVWRRLRKLGAMYLSEGVWVAPNTTELSAEIKDVLREIDNFQGTASAFVSQDLDEGQRERLRSRFLAARGEEYAELQGQCARFLHHVEHATKTERFTFAEVEELEQEISKLEVWLEEIRSRDPFGSPEASVSADAIELGRRQLQAFTERAFAESSDAKGSPPLLDSDVLR